MALLTTNRPAMSGHCSYCDGEIESGHGPIVIGDDGKPICPKCASLPLRLQPLLYVMWQIGQAIQAHDFPAAIKVLATAERFLTAKKGGSWAWAASTEPELDGSPQAQEQFMMRHSNDRRVGKTRAATVPDSRVGQAVGAAR